MTQINSDYIFIFGLITIVFLIRSLRNILLQLFLWQLKEYRFDRMVSYLKTSLGKKLVLGPFTLTKWIIFIIYAISAKQQIIFPVILLFCFIWTIEAVYNVREIITRGWKIPVITPRIIFIFLLFILIYVFIIVRYSLFYFGTIPLWFLHIGAAIAILSPILDKLLSLLVIALVAVTNIPRDIYTKWVIVKAKNKFSKMNKLKVIGITGSVGKTSAKEFLAQILKQKYKVDKTPASNNTLIGIARFILDNLNTSAEVFITEMGAYKKGEVKAICDVVHPNIGIVTAIGKQHIDLFGSQENIVSAKFELISSLPRDGVAIFNGDNSFCLDMAQKAKQMGLKTLIYGTAMQRKFDITATDIKVLPEKLEFNIHIKSQNIKGETRLIGIQNIPNILAAVSTAHLLGVKMDDIEKSLEKLTPADETMNLVGKTKGVNLIDDTFNASPESLQAALDYMKIYKGKKILVLTPLIELGGFAPEIHRKFGEEAARICDIVFLTNQNYIKDFMKGAERADRGREKVKLASPHSITELVKDKSEINAVAIFEGKEAAKFLSQLI